MIARIASDDLRQCVGYGLQERAGRSRRGNDAQRVSVSSRILGGQVARFTLDPHLERAVLAFQLLEPALTVFSADCSLVDLTRREIAERAQDVTQGVCVL